VVNFLPIPIVDGGLFVFLIIEKIMGKPLSPKAQSIAQIVGLALIASVFLFVTYHDIARLIL
jgi:regulator of sigma E protease